MPSLHMSGLSLLQVDDGTRRPVATRLADDDVMVGMGELHGMG
jgi:hypothetical protein